MPSGQVTSPAQLRTQALVPSPRTGAHWTMAVPVAGGTKQSHSLSQASIEHRLPPPPAGRRQRISPFDSPLSIQLHSELSVSAPFLQAFHSPIALTSHMLGTPVVLSSVVDELASVVAVSLSVAVAVEVAVASVVPDVEAVVPSPSSPQAARRAVAANIEATKRRQSMAGRIHLRPAEARVRRCSTGAQARVGGFTGARSRAEVGGDGVGRPWGCYRGAMLGLIGRMVYRLRGWRLVGALPPIKKFVIIGAPHTSNWDGMFFLAGVADLGVRLRFLSKPENLRGVRGPVFRYFGAIGVDRKSASNVVAEIAAQFDAHDSFILALGPEGTRGYRPYWRSGFYHIARAAGVPVVPIGIHASKRRIIIGPPIDLTGDVRTDMDRIRAFYAENSSGIYPDKASPVRLREEVEDDNENA